jgi:hypothetical protein
MNTDEDLAELFDRAVADLTPNVNAMVREAERLGRRLRRRIRLWRVAGSGLTVIAVAGAGIGAWLAHPLGALGGHANVSLGSGGQAPVSSHSVSAAAGYHRVKADAPAGQEQSVAAHAALKPMPPRQMLRLLRSMLPAGAVLTTDPTATNGPGSLEVNYNDGHGKVDIMLDITPFDRVLTNQQLRTQLGTNTKRLPWVLALSCPNPLWTDEGQRPNGALPISCSLRTPQGGGIERDAVMYADSYGFYGYDIYDQRPDGVEVFIQVGNGYFDPYLPHVDRATPPGSMSLWESVVDSPAWHG